MVLALTELLPSCVTLGKLSNLPETLKVRVAEEVAGANDLMAEKWLRI